MIENPVKNLFIVDFSCSNPEPEVYQFVICTFNPDSIHNLSSKEAAGFQGGRGIAV